MSLWKKKGQPERPQPPRPTISAPRAAATPASTAAGLWNPPPTASVNGGTAGATWVVSTTAPQQQLAPRAGVTCTPAVLSDPSVVCAKVHDDAPANGGERPAHADGGGEEDRQSSCGESSAGSVGPSTSSSAGAGDGAGDVFLSLVNAELKELENLLALTQQEQVVRANMIQIVQQMLEAAVPGAAVNVYGSWCTNLALPSSDVDFVVLGAPQVTSELLDEIAVQLEQQGLRCTLRLPWAKVPLLKFVSQEGLRCDVTFDVPTWQASVDCVRDMLCAFQEYHVRLLIVVLKLVLVLTSMNDVSKGGLSSYGLCLMVFAFVRRARTADLPKDPAGLFIELLRHYGLRGEFDPTQHTVDCNAASGYCSGVMEPTSAARRHRAAAELEATPWCVQDPLLHSNNVAEACWQLPIISQHFADMYERLSDLRTHSAAKLRKRGSSAECPLLLHSVDAKSGVLGQFVESRRQMQQNWQMHGHMRRGGYGSVHTLALPVVPRAETRLQGDDYADPAQYPTRGAEWGDEPVAHSASLTIDASPLPLPQATLMGRGARGLRHAAPEPAPHYSAKVVLHRADAPAHHYSGSGRRKKSGKQWRGDRW